VLADLEQLARPRHARWDELGLVAFDQEEWGMVGSKAPAEELRQQGQPLHLMLSLEMLGYTAEQRRYPVAALLPGLSRAMGAHVTTRLLPVPFQGRQLPDVRLSDHSPFWDAGYNAVMVTDSSFMRNPHYHHSSDTIDTLDLPFLLAVIDGLEAAIGGC